MASAKQGPTFISKSDARCLPPEWPETVAEPADVGPRPKAGLPDGRRKPGVAGSPNRANDGRPAWGEQRGRLIGSRATRRASSDADKASPEERTGDSARSRLLAGQTPLGHSQPSH
ncbi:hypothetical protein HPB47_012371 [Ixodes persulcatus]|uniref:Uncharacterized protein n=1 Tax=Ixodes persulcatus TaxID=34615 RepID=A0AC60NTN8_IXOPE|nr:hypothetical protein HPB47_012371 [Ixodes persulcatus]